MEFLGMLVEVVFDLLFCKVCRIAGQAILDAARPESACSAIVDKAGDAMQQGGRKRVDKGAFLADLVGLAFWCVGAAGLYLLCVI